MTRMIHFRQWAGHGLEMGGANYLLPIDAQLLSDRDVEDEAISLNRMLRATERANTTSITA